MITEYAWKKGFPWADKADAGSVAKRIISLSGGGKYPSAADILEDGRDPSSPQHPIFQWDDSVAAEHYRLSQARDIVAGVVIVRTGNIVPKKPIRAFVHVVPSGGSGREVAYVNIRTAMQDSKMRHQVIENALTELEIWKEKYDGYVEFAQLIDEIDKAMVALKGAGYGDNLAQDLPGLKK